MVKLTFKNLQVREWLLGGSWRISVADIPFVQQKTFVLDAELTDTVTFPILASMCGTRADSRCRSLMSRARFQSLKGPGTLSRTRRSSTRVSTFSRESRACYG
jgi:hypothetical protein